MGDAIPDPFGDDPLHPWNLPYEDDPAGPTPHEVDVTTVYDGLVVKAVTVPPIPGIAPLGALIFEFHSSRADARALPPLLFVGTAQILRNCGRLVRDTANRAANLAEGKR